MQIFSKHKKCADYLNKSFDTRESFKQDQDSGAQLYTIRASPQVKWKVIKKITCRIFGRFVVTVPSGKKQCYDHNF